MSDRNHSSKHAHDAHTIRASDGGGGKWLLVAVAAVVIAGGGYAAYQMFGNQRADTQAAYTDSYADESYGVDPLRVSPSDPSDDILADTASTETEAAPPATAAAAPAQRSAARAASRTPQTTVAEASVPEETIGIMPVNAVQDSDEIVVTPGRRPVWTRTPSQRRLASYYPETALERGREGEALLHCTVQESGALACVRASETPGGFGSAAMRLARAYRHSTTLADGRDATGTPVNLRVLFRLEEEERRFGRG